MHHLPSTLRSDRFREGCGTEPVQNMSYVTGSGKHQRAAAALMAALTESGVSRAGTGTDVSEGGPDRGAPGNGVSPSTTDGHGYGYRDGNRLSLSHLGALNHDLHIFTPSGEAGENGTHTPHYPPRGVVPPLDTIVEDGIQTDQMKIKGRNGKKESSVVVKNEKMIEARLELLKGLSGATEMETPTPKPRNRRKVANPTKTE